MALSIAFLLHSNIRSGANLVTFMLARHLARRGHSVEVLVQERFFPLDISFFDADPGFTIGFVDEAARGQLRDVVMTVWWQCAYQSFHRLPARGYALYRHGCEKNIHAPHGDFFDGVIDNVLREDLTIFCVNRALQAEVAALGRPALLVRNGVDYETFSSVKPSLPPKTRKLRVLVEGPLEDPSKRVRETLGVAGANPDIESVHLAASGTHPADVRIDHGFIGLAYKDVPGVYASCDVIVKMGELEAYPMPMMETFAAGGTAVVGFKADNVEHEHNGLLVGRHDWSALGAALQRLVDDPALLSRLRGNAQQIAERLSWREPFDMIEQAFQEALGGRPQSVAPTPLLDAHRAEHQAILDRWVRFVMAKKS